MKTNIGDSLNDLRGKMGKWVYRRIDGQVVIARKPLIVERTPSEAQARHYERFRRASLYAQAVFRDAVRKAVYEAKARLRWCGRSSKSANCSPPIANSPPN